MNGIDAEDLEEQLPHDEHQRDRQHHREQPQEHRLGDAPRTCCRSDGGSSDGAETVVGLEREERVGGGHRSLLGAHGVSSRPTSAVTP